MQIILMKFLLNRAYRERKMQMEPNVKNEQSTSWAYYA